MIRSDHQLRLIKKENNKKAATESVETFPFSRCSCLPSSHQRWLFSTNSLAQTRSINVMDLTFSAEGALVSEGV